MSLSSDRRNHHGRAMAGSRTTLSYKLPPLAEIPPGIVAVNDFAELARERMSDMAWTYLTSGSADEITLQRNRTAFDHVLLHARMLAEVAGGNTRVTLFGRTFEHPILLAPVAYQKLAHPEAELAVMRGAKATNTGIILSTLSSFTLEEVAPVAPENRWFQLYAQADRGFTRALVQRAEAAGYQALVVTVDTPTTGARNHEQRVCFHLPAGMDVANLRGLPERAPCPPWPAESTAFGGPRLDAALTWKDLTW
ncbi:MAG: alpha-hydroxy acid oxidase, partial [Acidobacteriota bacterium]